MWLEVSESEDHALRVIVGCVTTEATHLWMVFSLIESYNEMVFRNGKRSYVMAFVVCELHLVSVQEVSMP